MAMFDLVMIGAGPGGYVGAIRAAQLGMKVALVERQDVLGGTCLHVGCVPSKCLLESSWLYETARRHFGEHGIVAERVDLDLAAMMRRKQQVVTELNEGIALLMKKNKVTVVRGHGRLAGQGTVEVETAEGVVELRAPAIVLATGSEPAPLPGIPFDGERVVTSTEALAFDRVPSHLVVVGAGAIGLELGSVWHRLGARVTVVELLPRAVPFADRHASQMLHRSLKQQGLEFRFRSRVTAVETTASGAVVSIRDEKGKTEELGCDRVLVAVGRRPHTAGLGLDRIGVALDPSGRVQVDERYRTSAAGVYAIGDLIAGPMLAHKAEEEGVAVAELLSGKAGHVSYHAIPSVVYTEPELAQVGLTEDQVEEQGTPVRVGKFFFKANCRAKSLGQTDGLVKIIAHAETDALLGVHVVGPRASDLIAEAVVAVELGARAGDLARAVHAHPTLSEAVKEAALAVDQRAIHG
jgi:dihydrolipoamide dehydrogenase